MSVWFDLLMFAVGVFLIVKGGGFFVDSASFIAEVSGIPKFIIGATVVSLATTTPEMIVSVMAAAQGKYEMAVGNAVGSVTANTGMILSVGIIFMSIAVARKKYFIKGMLLVVAVITVWLGCLSGHLSITASVILLLVFAAFVCENIRSARADMCENIDCPGFEKKELIAKILLFVLGAAMLVIGSDLLVDHGSNIATYLKIPEGIIAVTMVAIGTSLPELVTTVTAIVKKQAGLSAGNIIGANIIDLTLILPVSSLVSQGQLTIGSQGLWFDMPACLIIVLTAIIPTLITEKFDKWQGVVMLTAYAGYLYLIVS